jgi:hypothetical protein
MLTCLLKKRLGYTKLNISRFWQSRIITYSAFLYKKCSNNLMAGTNFFKKFQLTHIVCLKYPNTFVALTHVCRIIN